LNTFRDLLSRTFRDLLVRTFRDVQGHSGTFICIRVQIQFPKPYFSKLYFSIYLDTLKCMLMYLNIPEHT
jgi:hypothetical protein